MPELANLLNTLLADWLTKSKLRRKKFTFVLLVAMPISSITSNIFSAQKLLCSMALLSHFVSNTACVAAKRAGLLTLKGGLISYSFFINFFGP